MKIFDRNQWNKKIALFDDWPYWLCSECLKGHVYPEKKYTSDEDMLIAESSEIKYLRDNEPGLDSDNYYSHAVIKLKCNNIKCSSESLLTGKRTSEEYCYAGEDGYENGYIEYFEPIFYTIPPQVIAIPIVNNEGIKFLYQSFKIFFDDPSSAANKIRLFLEYLFPKSDNIQGNLHSRLENELKQPHPDIFELLMACKWIGNDASHEADITHEDVLDAYEFVENALILMFPEDRSSIFQKAGSINASKKSSSKINQ